MASVIIPMPKVGEVMENATILEWLTAPGDAVEREDLIVTVMTDKVEYDVETPYAGTITRLLAEVDELIAVGAPLCEIELND